MTNRRISSMIAVATLIGAAAGGAHAADKSKGLDFTVRSEPMTLAQPSAGKTLKWDASKGRWGLTLNMQEPSARPSTLNDVQAGAYFRITPSLRVGGSVALGEQPLTGSPAKSAVEEQPRVRLETAFKF